MEKKLKTNSKTNIPKSLEEVWEMKESVWNDFLKSGYKSYAKFIEDEMIEIKKKYSFIFKNEEKEKES